LLSDLYKSRSRADGMGWMRDHEVVALVLKELCQCCDGAAGSSAEYRAVEREDFLH
jgi:hypothetical protein